MQQDRLARLGRDFEDREETRLVEAGTVDVGVKLEPVGVAVDEDTLGLLGGCLGRVHGQRAYVAREAIGMFRAQLGEAVVGDAGEFGCRLRAGHRVERRQPKREDFRVVVELIHHVEARVEIVDGAHALDAFTNVLRTAGGARHLLEQTWREEMAEGVDVAHGSLVQVR